jgi:hypothetical protein
MSFLKQHWHFHRTAVFSNEETATLGDHRGHRCIDIKTWFKVKTIATNAERCSLVLVFQNLLSTGSCNLAINTCHRAHGILRTKRWESNVQSECESNHLSFDAFRLLYLKVAKWTRLINSLNLIWFDQQQQISGSNNTLHHVWTSHGKISNAFWAKYYQRGSGGTREG